jgi:hypothetical protein
MTIEPSDFPNGHGQDDHFGEMVMIMMKFGLTILTMKILLSWGW